jgi:hypothetical protein
MISQLFNLSFWYTTSPVAFSPLFQVLFFLLFALCAVLAVLFRVMSRRSPRDVHDRRAFGIAATGFSVLSAFGFIWLFCTYEEAPLFGIRAWFILWILIGLAFAARVIWYLKKQAPVMRAKNQSKAAINKYLPRR